MTNDCSRIFGLSRRLTLTLSVTWFGLLAALTSDAAAQTLDLPTTEFASEGDARLASPKTRTATQPTTGRADAPVPPPLGFAGGTATPDNDATGDLIPVPDRWRIGTPAGYLEDRRDSRGALKDPYNQNVLKGDYPVLGQDKFLILTFSSDTLFEARKLPVPSGVSSQSSSSAAFFGTGDQQFAQQDLIFSFDFFQGDSVYKPRDYAIRATMVFDYNYLHVNEAQLTDIDVRNGEDRSDFNFALQELFFEKHLADLSSAYDFASVRAGIQLFNADFRGWLFNDSEPGLRFFGNADSNRYQWNIAAFAQVEKDTDSGLNRLSTRDQYIVIANLYRQDTFVEGYTGEVLAAANFDYGTREYDENGFLVRPAPIGTIGEKNVHAYYLGYAGEGKWGRVNVSHQFYQALGGETFNPIAGRSVDINAQFAAAEVSYDIDFARVRASVVYASGDDDPGDGEANGFDGIFDNPNFAGSTASYFARQAIRLTGSGVNLTNRRSFYPDLRTSKEEGQANFINPGLFLYNVGLDGDVTPTFRFAANLSYLQFADPAVLREVLLDDHISRSIGVDVNVTFQYRPFLNNNCIVNAGIGVLIPGDGFKDLYFDEPVYSSFIALTFTY